VGFYNSTRCGGARLACFFVAFLAVLGPAGLASGAIIADPTEENLGNGVYEDATYYTLADIITAGGIVIGDKLFDNFSAVTTQSTNAIASGEDEIKITAVYHKGEYGFKINGLWSAGALQLADTTLTYHASILPDYITQGYAFSDNTLWISGYGVSKNATTGAVSVSENIYLTSEKTDAIANEYVYYTSDLDKYTKDTGEFAVPVTSIWVVKDIGAYGGAGMVGSAHLSELYQTFSQTPEPGTLVLLGVGAIGFVGYTIRKRRASRG
jgi:hypothetical protein